MSLKVPDNIYKPLLQSIPMPKITFYGEKSVEISKDKTVLECSLDCGIPHAHVCGGNARCTTCRIFVLDGLENCIERNEKERHVSEKRGFEQRIRLACQTMVKGDIVCKRLVKDEEDIALVDNETATEHACSGEEKKVAVFFSDLRGFTTSSEHNLPYDVIHILNKYFTRVCPHILNNRGIIDKYIGDGLMAIFGVEEREKLKEPASDHPSNPTLDAVKAALGQLQELKGFNKHLKENYGVELKMGIGIHYGDAIVGNVGHPKKVSFTAIGDTVNTAARIESANKAAGTEFLISEAAYKQVKDYVVIGKIHEADLKGKEGTFKLYEVTGLK